MYITDLLLTFPLSPLRHPLITSVLSMMDPKTEKALTWWGCHKAGSAWQGCGYRSKAVKGGSIFCPLNKQQHHFVPTFLCPRC